MATLVAGEFNCVFDYKLDRFSPGKNKDQGSDVSQELMNISYLVDIYRKKGKRKVQGVPQSQTAALPRHQEEEETDKSKQAQIEKKNVRKALRVALSLLQAR